MSWADGLVQELAGLSGVELRSPARDEDLSRLEVEWGISLPTSFALLLSRTNGVSWKDGYGRLFGVGQGATRDIATWNSHSGWKSRYPPLWSSYLLIGEDARGYQWGFRIEDLEEPEPDPPVWFLGPETMTVSLKSLGDTFEEYAENGMLGNARGLWSAEDLELKLRFPSLSLDSLLLHAPPLQLIDADPDPQQFSVLPAEQVMRLHADAWDAAQTWPDGAALVSIRLEPDEQGWLRLVPVWSAP